MATRSKLGSRLLLAVSGSFALLASGMVLGVVGPVGVEQAQAATPACTDTWTNTAGGDWSTPGNWSAGVPGSSDVACITTPGTYTVEITAADGSEETSGLVLGAGPTTGVQTLQIDASASLTAGTTANDAGGALANSGTFTSSNSFDQDQGTTSGNPVTVNGTALTFTASGQSSFNLTGSSSITGSIAADQTVNLTSGSIYFYTAGATSAGTITVAGTGSTLTSSNGVTNTGLIEAAAGDTGMLTLVGSFDNQGSGADGLVANSSVTQTGTVTNEGTITVGAGATFTDAYILTNTAGTIANAGTFNVTDEFIENAGTVTGTPINVNAANLQITGSGQSTFDLTGSCELTGSVAADQTINLTSGEIYFYTAGATNAGTITVAGTGSNLQAAPNVVNTGLIELDAGAGVVALNGTFDNQGSGADGLIADSSVNLTGTLTNEGAVTIGSAATFTVDGTLSTTGTIDNGGTINVSSGDEFSQGPGPTSGNPVNISAGNLAFTGAGQSTFDLTGSCNLTGSIAAEQTLNLTSGEIYFYTGNATNAGTITVAGTGSTLYAGGGTVTNTGVIEADPGDTGVVMIDGPFDNQASAPGGLVADSNVTMDGTFTNEGTVSVATGTTFIDEYIMTNNAGTIANAGTFNVTNEFIENDGTATGNPINVTDAALDITGTGASSFTVVGPDESTLRGDIASGQTLTLAPGSSIYAYAVPLVNSGVIDAESTTAGTSIVGSVQNDGTFVVGSGAPTTIASGSFTQDASGTTQVDLGDPVNYGRLSVAGTASLDGQLVTSTSFTPTAGTGFSIINSTGALSGTFSSYAFGSEPYTIAYTPNSVEITGATGLAVTTTSLPAGQVASPYTAALTSSGGVGAVSWAVTSGALPAGLSLNAGTGAITGTPTAPGLTSFTVTATDSSTPTAQTASALLSIHVASSGLIVTTTSLPAGEVNDPYPGATLASTGGTAPITWKVTSGALPAGLSLNAGTGAITGTPTAAGAKTFSVTATDSTSPTAETSRTNLSISVEAALAVTTKTLPGGQDGGAYPGATLASTGGIAPVTWTVSSGALPAGLTLNPSSGAITGTPTGAGAVDSFTVAATDSSAPAAQTATATLSIKVSSVTLAIVPPAALPTGIVAGTYAGANLSSTGGTAPVTWAATAGKLPAGLTLNPNSGAITGTPTAAGTKSFTVVATDSTTPKAETATVDLSISVVAALSVTTKTLPTAQVGTVYPGPTLASTGGAIPVTWTVSSGALPAGLTLNPSSGAITGTPTGPGALTSFTVTATDSSTPTALTATANLSISVASQPLAVTTSSLPGGQVGNPYPGATLTSTGGTAPVSWAVATGTLPAGLNLSSTGAITGTPTAAGTATVTVTATDSTTPTALTAKAKLSISVIAALVVTTNSLPSGQLNVAYPGATLASTGGTAPITWAVTTGKLPAGLNLSSAGAIAGTPTATGTTTFTVSATDSTTPTSLTAKAKLSITVNGPALVVTSSSLPVGLVNSPYAGATLASTGGTAPISWAVTTGALPAGLTLNSTSGTITGTPTGPGAVSSFTVTATDSSTPTAETATANESITVTSPPLTVTTTALANGAVGMAYPAATLASTGGSAPITWAVTTGKLPAGLSLSTGGFLTGTPTAGGLTTFTVTATDSSTPTHLTAKASLSITIATGFAIQALPSPPFGQVGVAYPGISPGTTGGTAPVTWTATPGSLPPGLSLNAATGAITGTPTNVGIYPFTLTASDSGAPIPQTASVSLSITVQGPALVITTTSLPPAEEGDFYPPAFLRSSGGYSAVSWAVTGGSLPAGFSLSDGVISGLVIASPGVYQFTVTATDSSTPPLTAKATLSIAVIGTLMITTQTLPAGELGVPYSGATLASSGGTAPVTWTINPGNLPPGLSLNTATGAITGTPTTDGTWTFEVYANDSGVTDPQEAYTQMSIVVQGAPLQITPSNPPESYEYQSLNWQLAATGGQPPDQWTEAGALPKGVTLNASTGLISGTPTVTGSYNITVTVKDSTGAKASALEPIDINPPVPLYVSTPEAIEGPSWGFIGYEQPYSGALNYGGGEAPYTFAVTFGSLPPGLTLNRTTGVISGTPTANVCNPPSATVTITDSEKPAVKASTQVTFTSLEACG